MRFPAPLFIMEELASGGIAALGNILGSGLNYYFGEKAANHQLDRQKEMFDYQSKYNLPSAQMERLLASGVTPAAAAQSVAGQSQLQSTPSVSPRPIIQNGLDELGNHIMDSKLKTSEILGNNANTANTIAFGLQIEPLYKARIDNLISQTDENKSKVGLNKELAFYYRQGANQIKEQRPWQLQTVILGLQNLSKMIDERIAHTKQMNQDTKTSKALEGLYTEETETEKHKQMELDSETARNYSESLNLDQQGFALQFDNSIRSMGWNPSSSWAENMKRLAFTDPRGFKSVMDSLSQTADKANNWMQGVFGKDYLKKIKRLGRFAFLHYAGNKFIDKQFDRMHKFGSVLGSYTGALGNIVPFAHPSSNYYDGSTSTISW